jgi:hypothetical protein
MRDRPTSLADLVANAHSRCARAWEKQMRDLGLKAASEEEREYVGDLSSEITEIMAGAAAAAYGGDFLRALQSARLPGMDPACYESITARAAWASLIEACAFAASVDSFLATLDQRGPAAALARGCRADVAALAVLADCCDEHGMSQAAAEARYLYGLLREHLVN